MLEFVITRLEEKIIKLDSLISRLETITKDVSDTEPMNIQKERTIKYDDLSMNLNSGQVFRGEREVFLSAKEFDLLKLFLTFHEIILSREAIIKNIWRGYEMESNIIEVYIRYLRNKLEANGEPRLIYTVRGMGYVLRSDNEDFYNTLEDTTEIE